MGLITRIKDWADKEILTEPDLEAEFDNVTDGVNAVWDRPHNEMNGLNVGNYQHLLAAEYSELSEWLDNVILGSDGLTTMPEIVLTPLAGALSNAVGGVYFSNADKAIYVCTEE